MKKYDESILKHLHDIEIEILSEVDRICRKYNIQYFAEGGTALGAIRHNGFIPWDDDIDVGMLRNDYEKFCKVAPDELNDDYFLQYYPTDCNTPTWFVKVRKNNTLFLETYYKGIRMHHGIFVDIFPYDYVSLDSKKQRRHELYFKLLVQLFVAKVTWKIHPFKNKIKGFFYGMARKVLYIVTLPIPRSRIYKALDKEAQKFNHISSECKSICILSFPRNKYLLDDIFPTKCHPFDRIVINIPNNYDVFLKTQYGDYMTFPPENERYAHAPEKIEFDL